MAGRRSTRSDPRADPFGLCLRETAVYTADLGSRFTSYDDTDVTQVPRNATHCSYYSDHPRFSNLNAMRRQCPGAKLMPVVGFAFNPKPGTYRDYFGYEHGISCDCEPTDLTPAEAGAWAARCKAAGVTPVIYSNLSEMVLCVAAMAAHGLKRGDVKIHTAHWTFGAHICSGMKTAWGTINADATQWTDKFLGRNLDASLCEPDYFGSATPPPPPPPPQPVVHGTAKFQVSFDTAKGHWTCERELAPGSLTFTEHPKLAKATINYDMATGDTSIKAG